MRAECVRRMCAGVGLRAVRDDWDQKTGNKQMSSNSLPAAATAAERAAPEVWPVIHLAGLDLALSNAAIARACGCPGVFLIQMEGYDDEIAPAAMAIRARFPDLKIGANFLSLRADEALRRSLALGLDATWADAPGVRSDRTQPWVLESLVPQLRANPQHLFFGSVAFKYQPAELDPPAAALRATELGMVPTTSGSATGIAPDAAKLHAIRLALDEARASQSATISPAGAAPLAVASGISPENAYELGRFLTHILVATGVSRSFHELDEATLRRLVELVSGPF